MKLSRDKKKKESKATIATKKAAAKKKKATTSKDLPGKGQLKKVGKKIEARHEMLRNI